MNKQTQVAYLREFYAGRTVFVTGIQGFKGAWLALLLHELGARVVGAGLQAEDGHLYDLLGKFGPLGIPVHDVDVRDRAVVDLVRDYNPSVIFHLAAQPIVSVGYADPYLTFSSNVMGTVNVMDAVRLLDNKTSFVCVTTDKCYLNVEKEEPYREEEVLMGEDPYSSSKSCAELVAYSYRKSFFDATLPTNTPKIMSTCRAGNVIGGGDFAKNRIIPDLARALAENRAVTIRNFTSTRPYEHVLDALYAYVLLGALQWDKPELASAYNIGPNSESIMRTQELVDFFQASSSLRVIDGSEGKVFHEANLLALDSTKIRQALEWEPTWASKDAMLGATFTWYAKWMSKTYDTTTITLEQVKEFLDA